MCDTFICPPNLSATGNWIFGKNSDREPNEIQLSKRYPKRTNFSGRQQCTFIEVDHVKETFATILSQPVGMWGAEMGINEKGVTIGNEAVFTRISVPKKNKGLTGMDMLRLALESSATARDALEKLKELNEKYGQDANGGYQSDFYYHNSFLIADADEAFVLETAGKYWAVEYVTTFRAISNGLSIGRKYDEIHPEAIDFARKKSWSHKGEDFDFAKVFSAYWMPRLANCQLRRTSVESHQKSKFSITDAFRTLRTHDTEEFFVPHKGTTASVCMHASGLFSPQQTTASMVTEIRKEQAHTVWLTGSEAPCLSMFVPFYFESGTFPEEKEHWLKWEQWHRKAIHDYRRAHNEIQSRRAELETGWIEKDKSLVEKGQWEKLSHLSSEALQQSDEILCQLMQLPLSKKSPFLYRLFWNRQQWKAIPIHTT